MGDLYNPFPKLPKNIRQIGDTDQVVRLYIEDYVNTYLKRLYPSGHQTLRIGLLLGSTEQYDGTPYIFVDGAMEMEDVEVDGEKLIFSESSWRKAYQQIEDAFPKRTVQGWFLCGGPGSQLSPLNYWKQHGQYFAGKNQLMYLNHGLEGEESLYITSEDGFYRLKGHCIYYERNQMMQDYMITRKDVRRIEAGSNEPVIRDFRQRMAAKKQQAAVQNSKVGVLGMLCGVLSLAVLAGGVTLLNNYQKMQNMESALASVLPAGVANWEEFQKQKAEEPDFIIEEVPANLYPMESGETGEFYTAGTETMAPQDPANGQASGAAGEDVWNGQAGGAAGQPSGNPGQDGQGTAMPDNQGQGDSAPPGSSQGAQPGGEAASGSVSGGDGQEAGAPGSVSAESGQGDSAPIQPSGEPIIEEAVPETGSAEAEETVAADSPAETDAGEGDQKEEHPPIDYAAAAANGYLIYEVGDGETLYGICWSLYGDLKHLNEIIKMNYLENENRIFAGQRLIVP